MKSLVPALLMCLQALAGAGMAQGSASSAPTITGDAFDLDSGQLLYRELYFCEQQVRLESPDNCEVIYQDPRVG